MNREYELGFEIARTSADLASRIASFPQNGGDIDELANLIDEAEKLIAESKPCRAADRWALWLAAAHCVFATKALANAVRTGSGVADAKARLDILKAEFLSSTSSSASSGPSEATQVDERVETFFCAALPVLYWGVDRRWQRFQGVRHSEPSSDDLPPDEPLPTVARLVVEIDNAPLVSPQELRPGTLYHLQLEAHLASWPSRIRGMSFCFTTTLANNQYTLSRFDAIKLDGASDENNVVRATGTLAFPFAQNDPFRPVVFAVSAILLIGEERHPIRIVGHDQLQFRIREESRTLLSSGWPRMDAHLHDLLQALCASQPAVRDELNVLLPLLDTLTAVLGTFAQGGVLKGRTDVDEDEFQAEVLKLLRMRLGEDVQEGPKQAGGITDIRYRGCIIELKVESSISDRDAMFARYTSQPTQYQGVEARSVAILLVLDLVEKTEPPGDLRNDILLKEVRTHGGPGPYPSWAFMFVVRGNVKSPSSYSRS